MTPNCQSHVSRSAISPSSLSNGCLAEPASVVVMARREPDPLVDAPQNGSATDVVRWLTQRFSGRLVLSSSFGADSAVMLHLVTQVLPTIPVLMIDTGYLFPETYRFAEQLRERLNLNLVVRSARCSAARQEALYGRLWEQGDAGLKRYLSLNKVEPMKQALQELGAEAWIAGVRAAQTEHRQGLRKLDWQDGRIKAHPILDWSDEQVDAYLREHDLPRHPLYAQGFRSIGDWHSTRPVSEGEDQRAGRLLGEGQECGLHVSSSGLRRLHSDT